MVSRGIFKFCWSLQSRKPARCLICMGVNLPVECSSRVRFASHNSLAGAMQMFYYSSHARAAIYAGATLRPDEKPPKTGCSFQNINMLSHVGKRHQCPRPARRAGSPASCLNVLAPPTLRTEALPCTMFRQWKKREASDPSRTPCQHGDGLLPVYPSRSSFFSLNQMALVFWQLSRLDLPAGRRETRNSGCPSRY
jgi:hypothetical protein